MSETTIARMGPRIEDVLRAKDTEMRKTFRALSLEKKRIQDRLNSATERSTALEKQIASQNQTLEEANAQLVVLQQNITVLEAARTQLADEKNTDKMRYEQATSQLTEQLRAAQEEAELRAKTIRDLERKLQNSVGEKRDVDERIGVLSDQNKELERTVEMLKKKFAEVVQAMGLAFDDASAEQVFGREAYEQYAQVKQEQVKAAQGIIAPNDVFKSILDDDDLNALDKLDIAVVAEVFNQYADTRSAEAPMVDDQPDDSIGRDDDGEDEDAPGVPIAAEDRSDGEIGMGIGMAMGNKSK